MGQVVEPWVYGHSTGVSSLAIIVAAMFWTLLWGPVGLLLSTPLTVCLVVLGRHVEQLQFLDVLLGDRPALAPEQTFYQRLLAGDPIEIVDQAEAYLQTHPLIDYYDDIALKGLALAQLDVNKGLLDAEAQDRILRTMEDVIEDLAEQPDETPPSSPPKPPSPAARDNATVSAARNVRPVYSTDELGPEWRGEVAVLCVAGASALDQIAATVLAQIVRKHGIGARVVPWTGSTLGTNRVHEIADAKLICLSFLDPGAANAARYFTRRIRRHSAEALLMLGFWAMPDAGKDASFAAIGVGRVVTSLRQALDAILDVAVARSAPTTVQKYSPEVAASSD